MDTSRTLVNNSLTSRTHATNADFDGDSFRTEDGKIHNSSTYGSMGGPVKPNRAQRRRHDREMLKAIKRSIKHDNRK